MRSVKSDNKYRHPNGLQREKHNASILFFYSLHAYTHTHALANARTSGMSVVTLLVYSTVTLYSATVWQQMNSSAFIKK